MSRRAEARLWIAQRATAVVLALCVAVHLGVIIYAVRGGLGAAEILGRTRGNFAWGAFYSIFVVAVAVHGAIGLRNVASEWLGFRGPAAHWTIAAIGLALLALGMRAVFAVVAA
jgi:fumarate reductase subunit C